MNKNDDNGQSIDLGCFDTEEEAARAYDNAAYFHAAGFHQTLESNFPEEYKVNPPGPTKATLKALEQARKSLLM